MSGAGSVSRAGLVCRDDLEPGIARGEQDVEWLS